MTRKADSFGYAAGFDSKGQRLLESHFQTSRSVVRDVAINDRALFMVEGIHDDFAEQASIVAQNLRAIACLPLRGIPTGGDAPEILGILYLDSTKAMHSLSGLDQRILNKLAVEAGTMLERVETFKSIEQRKNLERDLALAEETQRSLLPREIPTLDYVSLIPFSRPTHYVGGDFYDFEVMDSGELIASLADVSGKGVAASLLSSMLLGCLQLQLRTGSSPQQTLGRLNKFLHEKSSGKFVTMFVFSLRPDGKGEFISAGHNPGYLYRASKNVIEELGSNSLILGAFDFASFDATPFELDRGDILLIYSDGLTEAENPSGEMFGEERVQDILRREGPFGAKQVHQVLLSVIQEFTQGRAQTDDMTFVIAQRT
jgi:serine phosphatase RsbU (regulator of sigma subunit)